MTSEPFRWPEYEALGAVWRDAHVLNVRALSLTAYGEAYERLVLATKVDLGVYPKENTARALQSLLDAHLLARGEPLSRWYLWVPATSGPAEISVRSTAVLVAPWPFASLYVNRPWLDGIGSFYGFVAPAWSGILRLHPAWLESLKGASTEVKDHLTAVHAIGGTEAMLSFLRATFPGVAP